MEIYSWSRQWATKNLAFVLQAKNKYITFGSITIILLQIKPITSTCLFNDSLRENIYPDESDLWDLLKCLFQAITVLTNFGLFLDLNFKNVQYSPLQKIEVYWGNAKVGNGHRVYYQQVSSEKSAIKEEGLSSE